MLDGLVADVQRFYPQIYLACHRDHVRARSNAHALSAHDSSILAHLDQARPVTPRELAAHLRVVPSTLSAALARLERLGYLARRPKTSDRRQIELLLTAKGAQAMAATSVLDAERVAALIERIDPAERERAVAGLGILARAARALAKEPS
jgi:DNA-binding MarR family transcriptional regulator